MDSDRKHLNDLTEIAQFVLDNVEFFDPDYHVALSLKLGALCWDRTDPSDTQPFFDGNEWLAGTPKDFIAAASRKLLTPDARRARIQAKLRELDETRTKLIQKLAEL